MHFLAINSSTDLFFNSIFNRVMHFAFLCYKYKLVINSKLEKFRSRVLEGMSHVVNGPAHSGISGVYRIPASPYYNNMK